jgi:hypothetical protein
MVEEGNPNFLQEKPDCVNFAKKKRLAFVIKESLQFQNNAYNFIAEAKMQGYLKKLNTVDEDSVFKQSIICEPREERKSTKRDSGSSSGSAKSSPQVPRKTG